MLSIADAVVLSASCDRSCARDQARKSHFIQWPLDRNSGRVELTRVFRFCLPIAAPGRAVVCAEVVGPVDEIAARVATTTGQY